MINESRTPEGSVLLYSGGMDSWLINQIIKPDVTLFIRIHTPNNELEYQKILKLQKEGKIQNDLKIVDFDLSRFERPSQNYFLPLRNLHFVTLAAHYGTDIYLGATGSSTHFDKNLTFADKSADIISYLLSESGEGPVRILLPYKDTTKTELLKIYLDQGGDIKEAYESTVSCYTPVNDKPCMHCTSCMSKFVAFYNNGYRFTEEELNNFIDYVENNYEVQKKDVIKLYERIKADCG